MIKKMQLNSIKNIFPVKKSLISLYKVLTRSLFRVLSVFKNLKCGQSDIKFFMRFLCAKSGFVAEAVIQSYERG